MTIFDHLMAGNLPASFVHEDERCVAFLDIRPVSPGHVLVVPRRSVVTLAELDAEDLAHLWAVGNRIAAAQQAGLGSAAQHFLLNDGPVANQSVPHVHLHVVPRYRKDGWKTLRLLVRNIAMLKIPPKENADLRKELDEIALKIRNALQ